MRTGRLLPTLKMKPGMPKQHWPYRDDGLAAFDKTPRDIENVKKQICKTFSDHNLKITIEANKKSVNYLDITLDLRSGTYKPSNKSGNMPQYANRHSNNPPCIQRSLPESINSRLSNLTSPLTSSPLMRQFLYTKKLSKKVDMITSFTTTHNQQSQSSVRETET